MFKRIIWSLISVTVIIVIYFGFTIYKDLAKDDDPEMDNVNEDENEETQTVDADGNNNDNDKGNEVNNPFNQKVEQTDLNDAHVQDYIHKMSHQKVIAEAKWGFFEITDERIDWLLEGLQNTERELRDKNKYIDILQRWHDGDFSRIDKDHNVIWELQGGTVGEATGIMSEEEEDKYIKKTKEAD